MTARRTTVATASALALALALALAPSTAAHAAAGVFTYSFPTPDGTRSSELVDADSGLCIDLPEVRDTPYSAHTPVNYTDATATVFTGDDCTGDYYSLRPGGRASSRLLLKSVVFS
ncbi:hypothetical protein [Nonomuraea candida]|uniref:hypothetical protein n=1 Tax=Nonomuraea candida TaxID=359159 RepID=UPI0005B99F4E|nr:hypothetical protein [Nonomuraea candida]